MKHVKLFEQFVAYQETLCEATVTIDALNPDSVQLRKLLKKHNVDMEIHGPDGPGHTTEVTLTGQRMDLEAVLKDPNGWDDEDLFDFIEESHQVVNDILESAFYETNLMIDEQLSSLNEGLIRSTLAWTLFMPFTLFNVTTKFFKKKEKIKKMIAIEQDPKKKEALRKELETLNYEEVKAKEKVKMKEEELKDKIAAAKRKMTPEERKQFDKEMKKKREELEKAKEKFSEEKQDD
jgi:phosphoglycerate-specific signal transduction histidine kinase